jgi:hypothetical protein
MVLSPSPWHALGAAAALLCAAAAPARAEDAPPPPPKENPLELRGSVRLRFEAIDDQARAGFNRSDALFNARTILTADWHPDPQVHLVAELWDSRAYGGNTGSPVSTGEVNTLEPAQAYLAVSLPGAFGRGTRLDIQAGRFLLALGSRRLIAADDYRNTTNS